MPDHWEQRFAELEREVAELREELRAVRTASFAPPPAATSGVGTTEPSRIAPPPAEPRASAPTLAASVGPEVWVTRLGAVLVILGMTFFFKYAIDQGWISEVVRVLLGSSVGITLLAAGVATAAKRPVFSQATAGAGLATLAASAWAATALYALLPPAVGAALLAADAVLAVLFALRWASPPLAVLGMLGAYVTPVIVPSPDPSSLAYAMWFWVATAIVAAVYITRGWSSVFWTGVVATVPSALLFAISIASPLREHPLAATFFSLAVVTGYGIAPAARIAITPAGTRPGAAPLVAPLAWLLAATILYDALPSTAVSVVAIAVGFGAVASGLARVVDTRGATAAAGAQVIGVLALGVWAAALATSDEARFIAVVAAEVVAALLFVRLTRRGAPLYFAFVVVASGLGSLAVGELYAPSRTELWLACGACVVIVGAAWANLGVQRPSRRQLAFLFAHLLTMGAALQLGEAITDGVAAASVVWALLAAVEVVVGLRTGEREVLRFAGLTFAALSAKLLFVDLVAVPLALRVALFGGLGAALLAFGWFLPRLAPRASDHAPPPSPDSP